jgi:hypothetical protein
VIRYEKDFRLKCNSDKDYNVAQTSLAVASLLNHFSCKLLNDPPPFASPTSLLLLHSDHRTQPIATSSSTRSCPITRASASSHDATPSTFATHRSTTDQELLRFQSHSRSPCISSLTLAPSCWASPLQIARCIDLRAPSCL